MTMEKQNGEKHNVSADLEAIFRRALRTPDLVLTRDMVTGSHPNWDSLANVEILLGCEAHWHFEFDMSEIDAIRSFGDLHDVIVARIG
jgi:acyl carrier protein